jgi:hypothetical protein
MVHTDLFNFEHTEFVDRQEESVESEGSLSITGGLNSPWQVDLNKLSKILDKWIQS